MMPPLRRVQVSAIRRGSIRIPDTLRSRREVGRLKPDAFHRLQRSRASPGALAAGSGLAPSLRPGLRLPLVSGFAGEGEIGRSGTHPYRPPVRSDLNVLYRSPALV